MAHTKTASVPRPANCDVFDCQCLVEQNNFIVRLLTDLPAKSRLQLHISRPSEGYVWTDFDERIATRSIGNASGFEFDQDIDELDRCGLNKYRHWKGRWPGEIAGLPADKFVVKIVVNALEHQFGVCNRELTGSQIEIRKNGHWIERQVEIAVPIPNWLPSALP